MPHPNSPLSLIFSVTIKSKNSINYHNMKVMKLKQLILNPLNGIKMQPITKKKLLKFNTVIKELTTEMLLIDSST